MTATLSRRARASDLGSRVLGAVGAPVDDELLEMVGGDVDLRADRGPAPQRPRDLERRDGHVRDRGARLEAARDRDDRHPVGARELGEAAAARDGDARRAERPGGLVAGERLLGVARVGGAQDRRVGRRPGRQAVACARRGSAARRGRRGSRAPARRRSPEPPMPATIRPARRVPRLQLRGLDLPQRVAQVLGQADDVGEQVASVSTAAIASGSSARSRSSQKARPPSGTSMPGNRRAPRATTLSAPIVTPSPSIAPPRIWVRSPIRAPGPTMQSRRTQPAPIARAREDDAALDDRALPDLHVLGEDREAADVRAARRSTRARRRSPAGSRARRPSRTGRSARKPCAEHVGDAACACCPRGCRTSPAGSARGCRRRSSTRRRRRSRRARRRRAPAISRARSRRCDRAR